jgi:hypothetical protein
MCADFGFTERQARFLVTVIALRRVPAHTAFAGIVHGQKTRKFFRKLVSRGYVRAHCAGTIAGAFTTCTTRRSVLWKAERFMAGAAGGDGISTRMSRRAGGHKTV